MSILWPKIAVENYWIHILLVLNMYQPAIICKQSIMQLNSLQMSYLIIVQNISIHN